MPKMGWDDVEEVEAPASAGKSGWDLVNEATEVTGDQILPPKLPEKDGVRSFSQQLKGGFRGLMDIPSGLMQASAELDPLASLKTKLYSGLEEKLGVPLTREGLRARNQASEAAYQAERGSTDLDVPRLVGNVAGSLPFSFLASTGAGPTGMLGWGVNRLKDAAFGAGVASLNPVYGPGEYVDQKAEQAKMGALGGAFSGAVTAPLSRIAAPRVSNDIQQLREMGVVPTIGQRLGPMASRIEQASVSTPLLGSAILSGRRAANDQYNVGIGNRILSHVGERLPRDTRAGHGLIDTVGSRLSNRYEQLLPNLNLDLNPIRNDLAAIQTAALDLPDAQLNQFNRIMQNRLFDRFSPQGHAPGDLMKQVDSDIGRLARENMRSPDVYSQDLGLMLRDVQSLLRRELNNQNPQYRGQLSSIDSAWADFLRMERAASMLGARDGVFTPGQLLSSAKALDPGRKKAGFSRGTARMQPIAEVGNRVLGSDLPDSGTALRLAVGAGMLGGYVAHPGVLLGEAAMAVPYVPGIRRGVDALMSGGAGWREQLLGRPMRSLAPLVGGLSPLTAYSAEELEKYSDEYNQPGR